ncbi:MAG TPA: peptide chain release factor N(5)-glutamine methyltransferase [Armatimonadota bacterium]
MCASSTIEQLLKDSAARLREAGVETPSTDAELLLCNAASLSRIEIFAHPELEITGTALQTFNEFIDRRVLREPLPYITGERPFYDLTFEVTPDVLIPRQETEFLVEASLHFLRSHKSPVILDIGVGSGAIAICIAKHIGDALVYGTDTSPAAISVAIKNAERYELSKRTIFRQGDMLTPFQELTFDLIVSNPPYIPSNDIPNLQLEVSQYEPHQALDGGTDGLDAYRRLVPEAIRHLKESGALAMEVGIGEAEAVADLCVKSGFAEVHCVKDYAGIDRVVVASVPSLQEWGPGPLVDPIYPDMPKEL